MCTAISYLNKDHYFGRTLDYEYSYQEKVIIAPRQFPLVFQSSIPLRKHYAFIGMATISNGYPLYYDGTNEYGLSIAALNFPANAIYSVEKSEFVNIAHFEIIPWVLGSFQSVDEFLKESGKLNITNKTFSEEYPAAHLHWLISDAKQSVVLESTAEGLHIYENMFGVLTNNPPFPYQKDHIKQYLWLTNEEPNSLMTHTPADSRGYGSIGLPGDLTSRSRFVRAFYTKHFSVSKDSESASLSQFFHILGSVAQTQGCVKAGNLYVKTIYTSCCNTTKGIYYYQTYENSQITGVRLRGHDLDCKDLICYPLIKTQQIHMEN